MENSEENIFEIDKTIDQNNQNDYFYFSKTRRNLKNTLNLSSEPTEKLRILSQSALKDLNDTIGKSKSFIEKTSKKYLELTNNRVMKNVVSHLKNYFSSNTAEPSYQEIETDLNNNVNMNSTFLNDHTEIETDFSCYSNQCGVEILHQLQLDIT